MFSKKDKTEQTAVVADGAIAPQQANTTVAIAMYVRCSIDAKELGISATLSRHVYFFMNAI